MSIPIIDQLSPLGNFPAVDAADVQAGSERLSAALTKKVDKEDGKGLSTNDYTNAEKNKLSGIEANANNYVHPTTAGNKHIPAGGSAGKILGWAADGTAQWVDDHNTEYSDATTSTHGLMSAADKSKLDGIEAQANRTVISTTIPETPTNTTVPSMKLVNDNYVLSSDLSKFQAYVTPEMYGAVGDGITDDTAAIQATFDHKGLIIFAPNKTYLISATLVVDSYTTVDFNNSTIKAKADAEFIHIDSLECMIRNNRMGMMDEEKDQNIILKNLILDNNSVANTAEAGCIHFRAENSSIENVRIKINGNNMWGIILFSANSDVLINKVFVNNDSIEGSLGGCLWVRTGINNGRPTKNVIISNSRFESSAKDEIVALMSSRINTSVTVKMINCYILGKAINNLPDFLLTFRSQNSGAFIEGELIANTIEGRCKESLLAVSGTKTKGFFDNGIITPLAGRAAIVQSDEFKVSNSILKSDGIHVSMVGGKISNSFIEGTLNSCEEVIDCMFLCEDTESTVCDNCYKTINNIIKTRGVGIHFYGDVPDIMCMNNVIFADKSAISAQPINENDENANLESAIICNNVLQRLNANTSNINTIGINFLNSDSIICKNNIVYVAANNVTANSIGYKYGVTYPEGSSADNLIKFVPV